MQRRNTTILILSVILGCSLGRDFTIDSNDAFKIVQFNSLYIDNDATNYAFTMANVQNIIDEESPVDLVVLVGDTVDPDKEESYSERFSEAIAYFKIMGIPWVSTGGVDTSGNLITREQMMKLDQSIGADEDLSYTAKYNTDSKYGLYTQRIPVKTLAGNHAFNVWIMDSQGDDNCYNNKNGKSCISYDAITWFKSEASTTTTSGKGDLIFTTNPIQEMMTLANTYKVYGIFDQQVCCQAINTGLFQAAVDSGKIGWISCGADSNNDFKGASNGINLAYGRKSGFGGNGDEMRGARVFKVNVDVDGKIFWTQSWIRDFEGNLDTQDTLVNTMPSDFVSQTQCCSIYDNDSDSHDETSDTLLMGVRVAEVQQLKELLY